MPKKRITPDEFAWLASHDVHKLERINWLLTRELAAQLRRKPFECPRMACRGGMERAAHHLQRMAYHIDQFQAIFFGGGDKPEWIDDKLEYARRVP